MSRSYLFNGPSFKVGQLNLIAVPRWLELSLKSKQVTLEQALAGGRDIGFGSFALETLPRDIMSDQEVCLHSMVTGSLGRFLFPTKEERGQREQLYAELVRDWHAVPMVKDLSLNLDPFILGENLIGVRHVEEQPGVTDTDLYGRILRCAHTLAFNKIGVSALGCDLIKDVLYEISVGQH